jgi:hypothetical protein
MLTNGHEQALSFKEIFIRKDTIKCLVVTAGDGGWEKSGHFKHRSDLPVQKNKTPQQVADGVLF